MTRRRVGRWAAALCLLLATGCGEAGAAYPPPVDRVVTMPTAAGPRTAQIHHPTTAPPGAPLVVVLHGAGSSERESRELFGWDALADRSGFVVAYPDGVGQTWNAGGCCGRAVAEDVDDSAYLHELTTRLVDEDQLDRRRVYAVGISNGGMMAYAWACSRPGELAGIGAVAAARLVPCDRPDPLTVVAIHGTADEVVPLIGGAGLARGSQYPSLDESLGPFHRAASCPQEPQSMREDLATVATWRCPDGHTLVRDILQGTTHLWSGSGPAAGTDDGPADATGFLWGRLRGARA